jgi:hypothetical protein
MLMHSTSLASLLPEFPNINPELYGLDIKLWTEVDISNDFAARAISLYLNTDHNLLSPFHRELFIQDLVSPDESGNYCSSAVVNALLYWCCVSRPRQLNRVPSHENC